MIVCSLEARTQRSNPEYFLENFLLIIMRPQSPMWSEAGTEREL